MRFGFLLAPIALVVAVAQIDTGRDLRRLYERHRWFDLQSAIRGRGSVAPLYRGAVAAAFDDEKKAQAAFSEIFQIQPHSEVAYDAHEWLTYLYMRHGLYSEAVAEIRAKWEAMPARANNAEEHEIVEMLEGVADQNTIAAGPSSVKLQADGNLPIKINGHAGEFLIDTDSNLSFISESAAKVFGLGVRLAGAEAHGAAGKKEHVHTAVADISVGDFQLQNVFFLVFPDTMGAFEGVPVRRQGALGVPALVALQRLGITSSGMCSLGNLSNTEPKKEPNLVFDAEDPIVQVTVNGRKLEMILDSGSGKTELFPPFAAEFPALLRQGMEARPKRERGFGGERSIKQVGIPKLKIEFGGFSAILDPAHLLLEPTVSASGWAAGRVGGDVMQQTHQITVDYRNMTIQAE